MTMEYNVAIIDDDQFVASIMRTALLLRFNNLKIDCYAEPVVMPMMDIYFIDNDFEGSKLAKKLLLNIRETNPNALVIVMSSTVDLETLEDLVNGGVNAIWDKRVDEIEQNENVFNVIKNYITIVDKARHDSEKNFNNPFNSIRALLEQWNRRLSFNKK